MTRGRCKKFWPPLSLYPFCQPDCLSIRLSICLKVCLYTWFFKCNFYLKQIIFLFILSLSLVHPFTLYTKPLTFQSNLEILTSFSSLFHFHFLSLWFSLSSRFYSLNQKTVTTFHLAIRLLTYFSRLTLSLVLIFLSLLHSCSSHFHFSSDLTFPLLFLLLLLPFSSNFHSTFFSLLTLLRLSLSLYFPPTFILLIHWLFLSISTRFLFLSLIWVSSLSLSHPYWNFSILSSSFSLVFIPNLSLLNRFTLGLLFYTTLYDLIFNTHTIALFQSVAPCTNKIWKKPMKSVFLKLTNSRHLNHMTSVHKLDTISGRACGNNPTRDGALTRVGGKKADDRGTRIACDGLLPHGLCIAVHSKHLTLDRLTVGTSSFSLPALPLYKNKTPKMGRWKTQENPRSIFIIKLLNQ